MGKPISNGKNRRRRRRTGTRGRRSGSRWKSHRARTYTSQFASSSYQPLVSWARSDMGKIPTSTAPWFPEKGLAIEAIELANVGPDLMKVAVWKSAYQARKRARMMIRFPEPKSALDVCPQRLRARICAKKTWISRPTKRIERDEAVSYSISSLMIFSWGLHHRLAEYRITIVTL